MIRIDHVHGGNPSRDMLDFSASINPLGPPRAALDAYHASLAEISSYPPASSQHLEAALAQWLGVEPEWILAGNGSTHLIYLLARVLKPRLPVIVTPTFSELANSLILQGIEPRALNTTSDCNFQLYPEAAIKSLRDGADAIFIGRPNSPTGTILKIDEAAEIAAACARQDSWCVFDEAFIDFVQDARSCIELIENNHKIIVLRSLTKIFSIPGLRVGCLIAHPETTAKLRIAIEPWSINVVADRVTRACLEIAHGFIRETHVFVLAERARISRALSQLSGLRIFPSVANFLMMEVRGEDFIGAFGKHMLKHGIAVRDLHNLCGCYAGLYRIGLRVKSDNDRFMKAVYSWTF